MDDNNNPYYLQSSDNLGRVLITHSLIGIKNFVSWERVMRMAPVGKNKLGFADGYIWWSSLSSLGVASWILKSVSKEIREGTIYSNPLQLSVVTFTSILVNKIALVSFNWRNNCIDVLKVLPLSSINNYTHVMTLWEELFEFHPFLALIAATCNRSLTSIWTRVCFHILHGLEWSISY